MISDSQKTTGNSFFRRASGIMTSHLSLADHMLSKFFALLSSLKTTTPSRPIRSQSLAPQLPPTDDSGIKGEREWEAASFHSALCDGPFELAWERGAPSVRAEGDQAQLAKLSVETREGQLIVTAPAFVSRSPLKLIVRSPDLERVEGLNGAQISAFNVSHADFRARQEGSGSMFLTGAVNSADFFAKGPGSLDASLLLCECVNAAVSEKAKLECHANVSVMATADSVGQVKVHGNPAKADSVVKAGGRVKIYGAPQLKTQPAGGGIFDHVPAPRNQWRA